MKDYLPLFLSALATIGVLVTGALTLRKDTRAAEAREKSDSNTTAITGLREAFDTQRAMTQDCRQECADLREELGAAQRKIGELEETIRELSG